MSKTKAELTVIAMHCQLGVDGYRYQPDGGPFGFHLELPDCVGELTDLEFEFFDKEFHRIKELTHKYAASRLRCFIHWGSYEWILEGTEVPFKELENEPRNKELYEAVVNIQKEWKDMEVRCEQQRKEYEAANPGIIESLPF